MRNRRILDEDALLDKAGVGDPNGAVVNKMRCDDVIARQEEACT